MATVYLARRTLDKPQANYDVMPDGRHLLVPLNAQLIHCHSVMVSEALQ
jgi:hypothetical protein